MQRLSRVYGLTAPRGIFCATSYHTSASKSQSGRIADTEEQSNFLGQFIKTTKLDEGAMKHFSTREWTRKIIESAEYEAIPFWSHHFIEHTGENRFFAQTVHTETTIPHLLAFRRKDLEAPIESSSSMQKPQTLVSASDIAPSPDVFCLMSLERGLEAHPSIAHGGFQCVLFDEIARFLILVHQNAAVKPGRRDIHYTLNMTTRFSAPVSIPGDVLVRATLLRREGRKWFTKADIINRDGRVLSEAESLWLTAKKS